MNEIIFPPPPPPPENAVWKRFNLQKRIKNAVEYRTRRLLNLYYRSNRLKQYFGKKFHQQNAIYLKKIDEELFELVHKVVQGRHPGQKISGKYSDCLFLINQILALKPKRVLECGSGVSSFSIAYAMKRLSEQTGEEHKFVSMEEHGEYLEKFVLPLFPEEWKQYGEFRVSKTGFALYSDQKESYFGNHYSDLPLKDYEFLYIDGPAVINKPHYLGNHPLPLVDYTKKFETKPFNGDCISVLKQSNLKTVTCVFDQRIHSVWTLKKLSQKNFQWKYHYLHQKGVFVFDSSNFDGITITPLPSE